MTKQQREETRKNAAEMVAELGGERCAPLVVFHYIEIGARVAENLTAEQIAQEIEKAKEEERQAAAAGLVCLCSAEWVGWLLESVRKFANSSAPVRSYLIKKYY